jgi:hypothetical protein
MKTREILTRLVQDDDAGYGGTSYEGESSCAYCGMSSEYDSVAGVQIHFYIHADDCPILEARTALGIASANNIGESDYNKLTKDPPQRQDESSLLCLSVLSRHARILDEIYSTPPLLAWMERKPANVCT